MAHEIIPLDLQVIEITTIAEFDDDPDVQNVMQFAVSTGGFTDLPDYINDVTRMVEIILGTWDALATAYTEWKKFRVRNVSTDSPSLQVDLDPVVSGEVAGDSLPGGVSIMLGFHTEKPGSVLRKFLGVPGEASCDANGQWTSGAMTIAATAVNTLLSAITVDTHAFYYGKWDEDTSQFRVPISGYVSAEPAYQRRRRRGTGA